MTRLTTNEILDIPNIWPDFTLKLKNTTQTDLLTVAIDAMGANFNDIKEKIKEKKVGILSISTGDGAIDGFDKALESIANFLGFKTELADYPDMAGLNQLTKKKIDILLCSDDHFLGAFNFKEAWVGENSYCTGVGYVEILAKMVGGLKGKTVHLIGAGPVGTAAATALIKKQASFIVYDLNENKGQKLIKKLKAGKLGSISELLAVQKQGGLFVQAAPSAKALNWETINSNSHVVHPAVPFALDAVSEKKWASQVWHDPLQVGVAVMLIASLSSHLTDK